MTLQNLLDIGRAMVVADSQAQTMEEQCERATVNQVNKPRARVKFRNRHRGRSNGQTKHKGTASAASATETTCIYCGGSYPHPIKCPAKGKQCNYCNKPDHFKPVCYSKLKAGAKGSNSTKREKTQIVRELDLESLSSTDDEYVYAINSNKGPKQNLRINGTYCTFLLDTCVSVNIFDEATNSKIGKLVLETNGSSRLMPYGGNIPLDVIGTCV